MIWKILILTTTFLVSSCVVSPGFNVPDIGTLESKPDCSASDKGCLEPVYGKEVIFNLERTHVTMSKETYLKIRRNMIRMRNRIQTHEDILEAARKK